MPSPQALTPPRSSPCRDWQVRCYVSVLPRLAALPRMAAASCVCTCRVLSASPPTHHLTHPLPPPCCPASPCPPAEVAVVSRGGWQRHSWKGVNQDSFLALPLAAGAACSSGSSSGGDSASAPAACASSAVAIGVFDGHGRAGEAASAHLRNALASGLLMHSQLALMAQPAECQQQQNSQQASAPAAAAAPSAHASRAPEDTAQEEAAALLERCFAAAASTMPSTGSDFSLSGSTAVMCLVQPGRWVPWVVGVHGKTGSGQSGCTLWGPWLGSVVDNVGSGK